LQPDFAATFDVEGRFQPAPGGPRLVLIYRPTAGDERGTIVFAPPLAEEMNKSRRMVAMAARALASDGWRVIHPDLYGCGDSAGDFADATWDDWVADLSRVAAANRGPAGPLWFWGLRSGALLAAALVASGIDANLLLWQPAIDGSLALNQFLRLRTSAAMLDGDTASDRKTLRAQLDRGESVEVAGYILSPGLASGLASARLALPNGYAGRIVWLEVVDDAEASLSPASERLLSSWRAAAHAVTTIRVPGLPFWQTVETTDVPELASQTARALSDRTAREARIAQAADA
jgi:uncharacterized protein